MAKMSLTELSAQMIFVYHSDPKFLEKNHLGNVLIMQNMLKKPKSLSDELKRITSWEIPAWTSIDQEGGRVNRIKKLKGQGANPSARTMSSWPLESVEQKGRHIAKILQAHNINLNLAPVLDPFYDEKGDSTFMAIEGRSFGDSPEDIARARAFCKGLLIEKVGCVLKHFPGYDAKENSDHAIALSHAKDSVLDVWMNRFAALKSQASAIMISSIRYGKNSAPAVFEKKWIDKIRAIDPNMPVLTDDLWGFALRKWINPGVQGNEYSNKHWKKLIRSAFDAGNDLMMVTYPAKAVLIRKYLVEWGRQNPQDLEQIKASVRRILEAKERQGLL
jgi:beta-N-acetylhexosaminidase